MVGCVAARLGCGFGRRPSSRWSMRSAPAGSRGAARLGCGPARGVPLQEARDLEHRLDRLRREAGSANPSSMNIGTRNERTVSAMVQNRMASMPAPSRAARGGAIRLCLRRLVGGACLPAGARSASAHRARSIRPARWRCASRHPPSAERPPRYRGRCGAGTACVPIWSPASTSRRAFRLAGRADPVMAGPPVEWGMGRRPGRRARPACSGRVVRRPPGAGPRGRCVPG